MLSTANKFTRLRECNQTWALYAQKVWLPRSSKIDLAITMYLFALQGGTFFELGPHVGGTSVFLTRIAQSTGGSSILLDHFMQTNLPELDIQGSVLLKNNLDRFQCKNFIIIDNDIDKVDQLPEADFYFFDAWAADIQHIMSLIKTVNSGAILAIDDVAFYGHSVELSPTKNDWPAEIEKEIHAGRLFPIAITGMRGFFSKIPRPDLIMAVKLFANKNSWEVSEIDYFGVVVQQVLIKGSLGINHCLHCQNLMDGAGAHIVNFI